MKAISYIKKIIFGLLAVATISMFRTGTTYGQQKNAKVEVIHVKAKVVDEAGKPIRNVSITSWEGVIQTLTNSEGEFSIEAKANSTLIIEAKGYKKLVIDLKKERIPETLSLSKALIFATHEDEVQLPAGLSTRQRSLVGAITSVTGEELATYPEAVFQNTLQGRIMGLIVRNNTSGLGNNVASLFLRGLSRGDNDQIITVVDGIERPIGFINPEEVETVAVLKDATAKILYGPRAANGVLMITTKRGKPNTKIIRATAQYGTSMSTRMPDYLNSADYAALYNEARENDGLARFYSEQDLAGYRESSGVNDLRYPDVDYNDYFLRPSTPFRKATLEYSGGTSETQYALMLGYTGIEGVENISTPVEDRVNIRGNLNIGISPSLKAIVQGNAIIETRKWGKLNQDQVFTAIRTHRPNEYPLLINDPDFEGIATEVGEEVVPPLGGSFRHTNNLYGDLRYGGFREHNYFFGQTALGLDLDLGAFVQGLSVRSTFTFDNYQYLQNGQLLTPITYAPFHTTTNTGADTTVYFNLRKRVIQNQQFRQQDNISRNTGWISNLSYSKAFGDHVLTADLSHFYFRNENDTRLQDIENTNTVLRLTYGLRDKIYLEGTMAYMGSNRFEKDNRYQFFPAVGAAWVLSEEGFLAGSKNLTFLKLKASYGILGHEGAIGYYLYENRFVNQGTVRFGVRNQTGQPRTAFVIFGNPDLGWEQSREVNVGLEGLVFGNQLQFELNYFNEYRSDIIVFPGNTYSTLAGRLIRPENFGETSNQGLEGTITWSNTSGDFHYQLGVNFIYSKNKVEVTDEIPHEDEALRRTGKSSDEMFGLVDAGLFRSADQVLNAPGQLFGKYDPGYIAYEDLNDDGLVDPRDQKSIGNSFPRTTLGVQLNLSYKRFGLFVLGTSELGVDRYQNNNYYWNTGEGKYSVLANNRYHPVNNPEGKYPALTTTDGRNNFRNSTFWLEDASFFRLKNVALSYTLTHGAWIAKSIRIFVRGTNLFVWSKFDDLDPEVPNAGVLNYPVFRTITGGVSVGF